MWERIFVIVRKEANQVLRHPRMRTMLFVPPLVQLIVFGYAVNLDADNVRMVWMDRDQTPESREVLANFQGSGRFAVTAVAENDSQVQTMLDSGKAQVVVRVLPGFGRRILRGDDTSAQIIIDGTNSNSASLISAYAAEILASYSASVAAARQPAR